MESKIPKFGILGRIFFLVLYDYSIILKHLVVLSLVCTGKFQQLSFSCMMLSWAFSQTFPMSAVIFNLGPLRFYFEIKPFNSKNTINSGGFYSLRKKVLHRSITVTILLFISLYGQCIPSITQYITKHLSLASLFHPHFYSE